MSVKIKLINLAFLACFIITSFIVVTLVNAEGGITDSVESEEVDMQEELTAEPELVVAEESLIEGVEVLEEQVEGESTEEQTESIATSTAEGNQDSEDVSGDMLSIPPSIGIEEEGGEVVLIEEGSVVDNVEESVVIEDDKIEPKPESLVVDTEPQSPLDLIPKSPLDCLQQLRHYYSHPGACMRELKS